MKLVRIGLLALATCSLGFSDIVTPAGLAPGTQYQLAFVTSSGFFATSSDISDYNAVVTSVANLNATLAAFSSANGVTWTVIGSTTSINANVNAPSSGLVFTLDGVEIASGANPLYSGSLLDPLDIDENGATLLTDVWTGSVPNGTVAGGLNDLGQVFPNAGGSGFTTGGWLDGESVGIESDNYLSLYALSSVITVPSATATPEPETLPIVAAGLAILFEVRRRRRKIC